MGACIAPSDLSRWNCLGFGAILMLTTHHEKFCLICQVEEFYNHTTTLFVRFRSSDLADIKMCQLQIALYNKGVFEALKETEVGRWLVCIHPCPPLRPSSCNSTRERKKFLSARRIERIMCCG